MIALCSQKEKKKILKRYIDMGGALILSDLLF